MKTHITYDDDEPTRAIAHIHPADPAIVAMVAKAPTTGNDGRTEFMWVRLPNGDLILGVFPQGDTYLACERDAQFPGV